MRAGNDVVAVGDAMGAFAPVIRRLAGEARPDAEVSSDTHVIEQ
jgi:hypothetical protein